MLFLYQCIAFFGVQFYLYYQQRYLLNRIDASLFLSTFLLFLFMCRGSREDILNQGRVSASLACVILLTSVPLYSINFQADRQEKREEQTTQIAELVASDLDHLYLMSPTGEGIPWAFYDVWTEPEPGALTNLFFFGGWQINSPFLLEIGARYGVRNPYSDCIDNSEIYVISQLDWQSVMDRRMNYIREHYNGAASAVCVKVAEDRYGVYRIVTTNPSMSLVDGAVDGSDCLDYKLYRQNQEGEIALSGSLSLDTGTSFASNIYVGIEDESGEENLYYVTQRENNGDYSQFSMVFTPEDAVTSINLYLDTGDVIYVIRNADVTDAGA